MSTPGSVVSTDSPKDNSSRRTMSRADRSIARNVHIYDIEEPNKVLGGLYLAQELTNLSLYAMLDIFIMPVEIPSSQDGFSYLLQTKDGTAIARNSDLFGPGTYYLAATGECPNSLRPSYAN